MSYAASPYRWVLLGSFALLQGIVQLQWIVFAPITGPAAEFYGVEPLRIGLLSMIFMLVYLVVSVPASWVLDRVGLRAGLLIGAILVGASGWLRGIYAGSYDAVLAATVGLAVAQPFVLNSITKFAAQWFPIDERATAAGIAVFAQSAGILIAMWMTPVLSESHGIEGVLRIYGNASAAICLLFTILLRERPATPPSPPSRVEQVTVFAGLKHLLTTSDVRLLLVVFFIGLGIFNGITTWVEQIVQPRGFDATQAGATGAAMMLGGMAGSAILPVISDRTGRRRAMIVVALLGAAPGLAGFTFATTFPWLLAAAATFGFFSMSAGPIVFQYCAEISQPAPEATSQGLLMVVGQISGALFVLAMDLFRSESGAMTPALTLLVGLGLLNVVLASRLPESEWIEEPEEPASK